MTLQLEGINVGIFEASTCKFRSDITYFDCKFIDNDVLIWKFQYLQNKIRDSFKKSFQTKKNSSLSTWANHAQHEPWGAIYELRETILVCVGITVLNVK